MKLANPELDIWLVTGDGERVFFQDPPGTVPARLLEWTRATGATRVVVPDVGTRRLVGLSADGRLAAFAAGTLPYDQLLAAAENSGQRCEAHFYAGTRELAEGDTAAATAQFRAALDTGIVSYFEYAMAQELLGTLAR